MKSIAIAEAVSGPRVGFSVTNDQREQAEARCAAILARIRKILGPGGVLGDADFSDEWLPLAAMYGLEPDHWRNARRLRDTFVAAILPDLRDEKQIRVQYARILALLNDYLWIWHHLGDPDSWPTVRQLEEDY
jgi:hypothetical protein